MIETFKADLAQAMRRHDAITVATLRMLISQVQYARIEAKRELTQDDYLTVLQRAVKTRREAIEHYDTGGRKDLADKERAEIAVVERYLPAAMSAEDMAAAVDTLLKEFGISEENFLEKFFPGAEPRSPFLRALSYSSAALSGAQKSRALDAGSL